MLKADNFSLVVGRVSALYSSSPESSEEELAISYLQKNGH